MPYTENDRSRTYIAGSTVAVYVGNPGMPGSTEPNIGTQYRFVALDKANVDVVELATGAEGEIVAGVTQSKAQHPKTPVTVTYEGRVPVVAGAPLAYGDPVTVNADGRAIAGTVGVDPIVGTCVQPASAAGVLATIDLDLEQ